jgi:hypothetical protein
MRFAKILSVYFVLVFVGGVQANVSWGTAPTGNGLEGVMLVDGGAPLPPPLMTLDGGAPLPPPSMLDGGAPLPPPSLTADGGAPLPPPLKHSFQFGTAV